MANLVHYIYTSAASHPMSKAELSQILEHARENNHRLSVTGILLYVSGTFFQVLEGDEEVVRPLYERIRVDPRQKEVTLIISEAIPKRVFGEWTMSYAFVSEDDLDDILDSKGALGNRHSVWRLQEGRARKLLHAFAEGRWRSKLLSHLQPGVQA